MSDSVLTPAVTKPIEPDDGDTTGPSVDNILNYIEELELPPSLDGPDTAASGDGPQSLSILSNADQAFTNGGSIQSLGVM
jgi:hypothetical protein